MNPLSPEKIQSNVAMLQRTARSRMIEIPISRVVDVCYTPTGTPLKALVASEEFTRGQFDSPEGWLVYIEGGAQGGNLGLLYHIPKGTARGLPPSVYSDGQYERDVMSRRITKIFLPKDKVLPCSSGGILMDLLQNPNIRIV